MLYDLSHPDQRKKAIDRFKKLLDANARVQLTQHQPIRSIQQNKYLHVILAYFAMEYGCDEVTAKQTIFKTQVNPDLFLVPTTFKDGTKGHRIKSTAQLTTDQMAIAIDRFKAFASEGGIYIPSPEEQAHLFWCEQQIDKLQNH